MTFPGGKALLQQVSGAGPKELRGRPTDRAAEIASISRPAVAAGAQVGLSGRPETCHGGAQVCLGGVPEFRDQGVTFERLLDDATLYALAAAVNQSDLAQSGRMRRADVLFDDRGDIARRERVQVEGSLDRNAMRHRDQRAL